MSSAAILFANASKGTPAEDAIPKLFKGAMKNYIKCLNVPFESAVSEDFYGKLHTIIREQGAYCARYPTDNQGNEEPSRLFQGVRFGRDS